MGRNSITNYGSRFDVYNFTLATVAAGATSSEYELDISPLKQGNLIGASIVCASTNYTLSIRRKTGVAVPSIDEIVKITDINLDYMNVDLALPFKNMDATQLERLYTIITNVDSSNATGDITLELYLRG